MTILIIAANPSISTTTGSPVGFWVAELVHPYHAFIKAGHAVEIASPNGGVISMDALSDPNDENGYSKGDTLTAEYLSKPAFTELLNNTRALDNVAVDDYDAIVVVGGQSPMFTFPEAANLHEFFQTAYDDGKVSAALCHGVALLLYLKKPNGSPFVAGRSITGFTNGEEDVVDQAVGQKVMPFRIEDDALKQGAHFVTTAPFEAHVVTDCHLVTGQQQNSGTAVAQAALTLLDNK